MYEFFLNNPVVSAWISIISVFGIFITIIGFIIQLKDKERKSISYYKDTTKLISNKISSISKLKIEYNNEPISDLSITNLKVLNSGNCYIEPKDFYNKMELKIVAADNVKMLDAKIVNCCKPLSVINASIKNNQIEFTYECIESREWFELLIYHTGTINDDIKVHGKIKGGKILDKTIIKEMIDSGNKMIISQQNIMFSSSIMLVNSLMKLFYSRKNK